jgi:hypothetical protein
MQPGEALTSHFPLPRGVDFGFVSVLRHDQTRLLESLLVANMHRRRLLTTVAAR